MKYWLENNPKDPTTKSWSRNLRNYSLYFCEGITWGGMGNTINARYSPKGSLFDTSGPMLFSSQDLYYILGFTNSCVFSQFIDVFSQGLSKGSGHFANVPYKKSNNIHVNQLVLSNIDIAKQDWDSHETSWDFKTNGLVRMYNDEGDYCTNPCERSYDEPSTGLQRAFNGPHAVPMEGSLSACLQSYFDFWSHQFLTLHKNEEELNRQFIHIYGLEDELTPDVPLDEITILQQGEISINNGQIEWHADVVMKQLLSYAVGCMMGRYRLDEPGLWIAHPNPTDDEICTYQFNGFDYTIDDDGIMPLMNGECGFEDNAKLRVDEFIRVAFGSEHQAENLNFIEQCLGKSIEDYLKKDFWKDHKKMYQNRPIYWLFSSKKGAFQVLAYMHRMNPYTVEQIRNKYLLPHIQFLQDRIADLEQNAATLTTTDRRKLERLRIDLLECQEYHERLHQVADQQIAFDLDDGVIVNHAKFGDVVAKIK